MSARHLPCRDGEYPGEKASFKCTAVYGSVDVAGNQGLVCRQCGVRLVLRAAEAWRWVTGQGGGEKGRRGSHGGPQVGRGTGLGTEGVDGARAWIRPQAAGAGQEHNAWRRVSCGGPQAGEYESWEDRGCDDWG